MSRTVRVDLDERSYDIHIGRNLMIGARLVDEKGTRVLIVSDSNVDPLHGDRCEKALRAIGIETSRTVVPAGETSKDLKVADRLYSEAVKVGLDRSSVIVALGGGMVGDLAGFVAATFQRGIRLIQVPTTLLAMVDSSVGGKTAVNIEAGKNLVGVFHQPVEVVADLATLSTLPPREYISGLAEVVKYGIIWDAVLFRRIEAEARAILDRDSTILEEIVSRCCEIKGEVVGMDELDSGVRSILNFGHTLGHAVEKVTGYGGMLHGEAVSIGMAYAARLSSRHKGLSTVDCNRIIELLSRLGLPVSLADRAEKPSWAEMRAAMMADKKAKRQVPRFVLADKLGAVVFGCEVPENTLEEVWNSSRIGAVG